MKTFSLMALSGASLFSVVSLAAIGTACAPAWLLLAVAILLTGAGAVATVEAIVRLRKGPSGRRGRR